MRTWFWLSVSAASALLALSGRASAQECASNDDCLKGYTCEVVGASGCGFACPDGADPCEPPPDYMCEEMEYRACVPGPCTSDDDCEAGMVCFGQDVYECPPVAAIDCAPGTDCVMPEPPECTMSKQFSCVPRYAVPCTEDADCGDGFDCVEDVSYACSGGAATPPSAGGGSDPGAGGDPAPAPEPTPLPVEPACTEQPAGTFHCEARQVECAADADCPTDWTCVENYSRTVCSGGGALPPSDPAQPVPTEPACPDAIPETCRVCADGSCGKPVCDAGSWTLVCAEDAADAVPPAPDEPAPMPYECEPDPTQPARVCAPPFSDLGWGGVGVDLASATGAPVPAADGQAASAPERDDASAPGEEPPSADSGHTASLGSGEMGSDPSPEESSGACAVSAPGRSQGGAFTLLGLLGLCALGLRRRARS